MKTSQFPSQPSSPLSMSHSERKPSLRRVSGKSSLRQTFKQDRLEAAKRNRHLFWHSRSAAADQKTQAKSQERRNDSLNSVGSFSFSSTFSFTSASLSANPDRAPVSCMWLAAPIAHNVETYSDLTGGPKPQTDPIEAGSLQPWLTAGFTNMLLVTRAARIAQRRRSHGNHICTGQIEADIDDFCGTIYSPEADMQKQIARREFEECRKRRGTLFW